MKLYRSLVTALLVLAAPLVYAQTSTWNIDSAHSQANFQIRHLGVSNVRGSISGIKGTVQLEERDLTQSKVEATLATSTVNTGNEGRDKHLSSPEFFDAAKNPTISFKSTGLSKASGKLKMMGDLTLNGVTKNITLDVDGPSAPQKGRGNQMVSGLSATGSISRKDFNFGQKYGEPMLGDDVKFTLDIEITK